MKLYSESRGTPKWRGIPSEVPPQTEQIAHRRDAEAAEKMAECFLCVLCASAVIQNLTQLHQVSSTRTTRDEAPLHSLQRFEVPSMGQVTYNIELQILNMEGDRA
jgi:hypothetical protein